MRFFAENSAGQGNCTEDRKRLYGDDSVRKIAAEITLNFSFGALESSADQGTLRV